MWMDKRMKKMIVAKIRYIKRNVFAASAVPNDINGFVEALSKIEDNELSEIEKSWYSYKLKDEYIDYMYQSKMIKKLIYSLMSPFVYFGISCKKRHLHKMLYITVFQIIREYCQKNIKKYLILKLFLWEKD
jgi:hypothetical protein